MSVFFLDRAEGKADEAGEDAEHASDLAPGIGFAEEEKTVGKANDGTATADRADDRNHRIRIAESEHVDVVTYYQKHGDHHDDTDVFDRFENLKI